MMIYNFFSWFEHAFSGKTKKDFGAKSDFHCQSCSTFPNRIVTIIILVIFHKTSHWNYDFSDFIRKKGLNSARFIGRSSFFGKKNCATIYLIWTIYSTWSCRTFFPRPSLWFNMKAENLFSRSHLAYFSLIYIVIIIIPN